MYCSQFFSNDIEKIIKCKSYTNKLESTSKINYYKTQFKKCKTNLCNSLIIHKENTKEIMSVNESVYSDIILCRHAHPPGNEIKHKKEAVTIKTNNFL